MTATTTGGLGIEDATVTYGPVIGIEDITMTVRAGEVVALLGPSGCGKSTLLRAIAGLEPLAAGRILWDGQDLASVPVHRRGFGMVFQDGQLFTTMTVARNIGYGLTGMPRAAQQERVTEMLELFVSLRPTVSVTLEPCVSLLPVVLVPMEPVTALM